jgi:hypothetical protein
MIKPIAITCLVFALGADEPDDHGGWERTGKRGDQWPGV